jgi:hypothetical protein
LASVIANLCRTDDYWTATVTRGDESYQCDTRHGSWQAIVPKALGDQTVFVRREVMRHVAAELQDEVRRIEKRERRAA